MSALAKSNHTSQESTRVTKISANARIDYILRFSKQAVLVINDSQQATNVSSQLIASLPEQHNIALVALSSKFNDIQIRCRIIEQIFNEELFDPEASLAVSIINFVKKSKQAISLIIDNSEHASLQIIHELCQLVSIAKQTNLAVNVVMFGSEKAGMIVASNKSIFNGKLSLLSATSGQLLSVNSAIFKEPTSWSNYVKNHKWVFVLIAFLSFLSTAVVLMLKHDSFTFSALGKTETDTISFIEDITADSAVTVLTPTVYSKPVDSTKSDMRAEAQDIYLAIENIVIKTQEEKLPQVATPEDIVNAMNVFDSVENTEQENASLIASEKANKAETAEIANVDHQVGNVYANNDYYLMQTSGYVIQIAAFSDVTNLPKTFLASLNEIEFKAYQRLLNGNKVTVITSEWFGDRVLATEFLSQLPQSLQSRNPWIKRIQDINNEITTYQNTQ